MDMFEDMRQRMRRMQDDMSRAMEVRAHGGAGGFSRDPFNTLALMDSDPFSSGIAGAGSSSSSGGLLVPAYSGTNAAALRDNSQMPLDVYKPHTDVLDMGDHFAVRAELPGMQKQDVKVDVKDGILNISAEHQEDTKRTEGNWVVQERRYGKFHRNLKLPDNVRDEDIRAKFKEGVLEVDLPKLTPYLPEPGTIIPIE